MRFIRHRSLRIIPRTFLEYFRTEGRNEEGQCGTPLVHMYGKGKGLLYKIMYYFQSLRSTITKYLLLLPVNYDILFIGRTAFTKPVMSSLSNISSEK